MTEKERKEKENDYLINGNKQKDESWNNYGIIYSEKGEKK